jgi:hypothetical protein
MEPPRPELDDGILGRIYKLCFSVFLSRFVRAKSANACKKLFFFKIRNRYHKTQNLMLGSNPLKKMQKVQPKTL